MATQVSSSLPLAPDAFGFQRARVALDCGDVSYIDEGEGDPIVLLHGAPFTSLAFIRVIRTLREHHRVLAPDLPGFGSSQEAAHFSASLEGYASCIEAFCRALGLRRIVFYLNDSSGATGLFAAARLGDDVAGLVVADTVPFPLTGRAWLVKQVLKRVVSSRPVRWLNRSANLLPWLVATVAPWLRPFTREERAVLTSQFDSRAKRERVLDMFESMGRDERFMQRAAALAQERLAEKPTLLLFGQFDPMRLVGGIGCFRRLLPRHEVVVIPLEAHFPILSSGERVASEVRAWWMRAVGPLHRS